MIWLLVLVTATKIDKIDARALGGYETIAECHVAATQIFWENMPVNQEAVCIRAEMNIDRGR
jgi:hypothetical protein